jgi:Spy/CpxP family protein refolding chaperone
MKKAEKLNNRDIASRMRSVQRFNRLIRKRFNMKYGTFALMWAFFMFGGLTSYAQSSSCQIKEDSLDGMMIAQADRPTDSDKQGPRKSDDEIGKGMGPHGGNIYGAPDQFKKRLGLSDAQMEKIKAINSKYVELYKQAAKNAKPKIQEMKKLSKADRLDYAKIRAVHADLQKIQMESRRMRLEQFLEIEQILTPDQSKKIRDELPFMIEERMKKKGKEMKD